MVEVDQYNAMVVKLHDGKVHEHVARIKTINIGSHNAYVELHWKIKQGSDANAKVTASVPLSSILLIEDEPNKRGAFGWG